MDAIEINNDDFIVSNVLIDASSMERILLFDTNKEALDLLKDCNRAE